VIAREIDRNDVRIPFRETGEGTPGGVLGSVMEENKLIALAGTLSTRRE
jgi:hypothetical protein